MENNPAGDLIRMLESDLVKKVVEQIMVKLTTNVWAGFSGAFVSTVCSWALGILVAFVVKYGDLLAYVLIDSWKNTTEAKTYEKAAETKANLPKGASADEIARAEQAQIDAANALFNLGS